MARTVSLKGFAGWGLFLSAALLAGCGDLLGTGGSEVFRVISMEPSAGAESVSVHASIRLRFSSELDPNTVGDAVRLMEGGRVLRVTTYIQTGNTVILEPTEALDFGMSFRVVLGSTLLSKSGKSLSDHGSRTFTTEGDPLPKCDLDTLKAHLQVLAHDTFRGRGSGTEDEFRAAHYLQELFQGYGLTAPGGDYLQPFEVYSERLGEVVSSRNVLAVVPGSGELAREWLVVGAHFDHIGLRLQADGSLGLHNGADDNGSGTVLLLETARIFKQYVESGGMPVEERRSVLFAAFGAEELGLLGSYHYADAMPVAPLSMTRAMINFDMVGRMRDRVVQIRGLGTSQYWIHLLINANRPSLLLYDPPAFCDRCSDFAPFNEAGVPFIWFFTGNHEAYHTPADDVEFINFQGMSDIGEVTLRALIRLAVEEDIPGP